MFALSCPHCHRELGLLEYYFQSPSGYTCPQCHGKFLRVYRSLLFYPLKAVILLFLLSLFAIAAALVISATHNFIPGLIAFAFLQFFVGFPLDALLDKWWRRTEIPEV